ncbi:Hypothetical protein I595_2265 [Croceitalea dokdonensis DOKDO 023]|uniref:DUF4177 domain-containing protein n=2 Tax=Croceitalea TaxID=574891 RepID=A0A0P7ATK1_9FLAO|nr:Hypothetical protein I595_2265 [Croceitalea dokdonensis DOKDO 023]
MPNASLKNILEMKEYKVVSYALKFSGNNQHLEDILNQHAREGWVVKDVAEQTMRIIFERDKNR